MEMPKTTAKYAAIRPPTDGADVGAGDKGLEGEVVMTSNVERTPIVSTRDQSKSSTAIRNDLGVCWETELCEKTLAL